MKKVICVIFIFLPVMVFSQVMIKGGAAVGNRWNETLNSQTIGTGFRLSGEKFVVKQLSLGAGISYLSFRPNKHVNVRYNSYSLMTTYYFSARKLQPYLGIGIGYTRYTDKTTIELGPGIDDTQKREKNYGIISPYLGLKYGLDKAGKVGVFLQVNTDFVPVVNIDPIGFASIAGGLSYLFHHK
ncbi:MAG: hypothetical protein ABIN89_05715 [Chitinophagaceae bacterium]